MKCAGGAVLFVLSLAGACATTPPTSSASSNGTASSSSSANASGTAPAPAATASLYERLGGRPAIEAVIDEFLANVAADKRIRHRFGLTDFKDLRTKLVDLVCQASGGPCTYQGLDMKAAHRGQRVKATDFDALVEDLVKALDKYNVPEREKSELLGALAGMKNDVVEEP